MKYQKFVLTFGLLMLASLALGSFPVNSALSSSTRGTVVAYTVQSAHPYTNNYDNTWTITKSGASQIRVYFAQYQTETNYDYLYVMDGSNNVVQTISTSTSTTNVWSSWVTGETLKLRLKTDYSVTNYGFRVTSYEYEEGGSSGGNGDMDTGDDAYDTYGASDSATLLSTPITGTGHIDINGDQYDQYRVAVSSGDEVSITFTSPSGATGIDFPVYDTTKSAFFTRSNVIGTINELVTASGNGYIYMCIDADASTDVGDYSLSISVSGGTPADTTAPTVAITAPANGATVSGTTSISFASTDNVGVTSRAIKIDGSTVSTSSSYSWDTTAFSNGAHTILCQASDAAGNTGSDSITVTVSNTVVDDGGELTNGVTANGHMNSADGADMYYIDISANAQSMYVVLTCGSADFDTYGRAGAEPTTSTYDWRGYTSGGEENTVNSPAQGRYYIMVDYYSGDADYQLTATITYAAVDTTAPTVSISSPSSGATVSGTTTISFTASDNVGVTSRVIKIDGTTVSTSSSYSWDTTAFSNGAHTILCQASDAAGNTGSDTHTVTVSNSVPSDDGGALTDGVAGTGHMDQTDGADMWYIDIGPNAQSMYVVLTCGSSDFDTYGRAGAEPTTSTYDWRGYTSGGEENTVTSPAEGRYYIMVDWYSGDDDYQLTATITYGGGGGGTWGTGGKYAIIVGISDYQSISDLSYCDEDATDFYNFLTAQGYECHVYGDSHTSNYPRYDGQATESVVRNAVTELATHAQPGDTVIFTTSGHGSGTGTGSSYLCMLDCSGSTGCYYDTEIAADFDNFAAGVNIMIFIDHCYSGGIGPEIMAMSNAQYVYCTTTCTEDGYGYDDPSHNNGAWTYEYLERYWVNSPSSSCESIYDSASATYPHTGGDACMEFDGNTGSAFYI